MVGTHVVKSLKVFHVDPVLSPEQRAAIKGSFSVYFKKNSSHNNIFIFSLFADLNQ